MSFDNFRQEDNRVAMAMDLRNEKRNQKNKNMREIKFRVWDNVDYMSAPFTLQELQLRKIQFTSDCKIMQYTGLKDKYGKDIYEGDVLKCYDWGALNAFIKNDIIVWDKDENGWNFESNWVEDRYDFRKAIIFSEIIGNIFQ